MVLGACGGRHVDAISVLNGSNSIRAKSAPMDSDHRAAMIVVEYVAMIWLSAWKSRDLAEEHQQRGTIAT